MMKLIEQSYRTHFYRPKPYILKDEASSLLIVATSWGDLSAAEKAAEVVREFVSISGEDQEVTNPYEVLTCHSSTLNAIRTGILLANDFLYRNVNKDSYNSGVEMTVIKKTGPELSIGHVGCPSILFRDELNHIYPISITQDVTVHTPLPTEMLGVDNSISPKLISFPTNGLNQLILVSRSNLSSRIISSFEKTREIRDSISEMTQLDPTSPFWIASLEFND